MENKDKKTNRIKDMPVHDRPREKLKRLGAGTLSDAELLAVLLRVGLEGETAIELGERIRKELKGIDGIHKAAFQDLCNIKGVGVAKAAQIKAAIELGSRLSKKSEEKAIFIHSPEDVFDYLGFDLGSYNQETLWILTLNTRNRLTHTEKLYEGTLDHSSVRIAEIFEVAIRHRASRIIIVHNHPSGDPQPSPEDFTLTAGMLAAGNLLDIKVLDHIIIAGKLHVSIKESKPEIFRDPKNYFQKDVGDKRYLRSE
ncbi:MAG TPA: DNA repair protein RadC [Anaerolineae bacterium]|nr:DNA repair protein RadC [Anaerolineae bacterium]